MHDDVASVCVVVVTTIPTFSDRKAFIDLANVNFSRHKCKKEVVDFENSDFDCCIIPTYVPTYVPTYAKRVKIHTE